MKFAFAIASLLVLAACDDDSYVPQVPNDNDEVERICDQSEPPVCVCKRGNEATACPE